ncbi:MAG: hypothetical protein K0Q64_1695, partial [Nitrobacter vulgaris]|nr:hypothetical protein [Nitrobacter vulgaris]
MSPVNRSLEDAGDLLGDERRPAILVIDPGKAEDHRADVSAFRCDKSFRFGFGLRIGPRWIERRILVILMPFFGLGACTRSV